VARGHDQKTAAEQQHDLVESGRVQHEDEGSDCGE